MVYIKFIITYFFVSLVACSPTSSGKYSKALSPEEALQSFHIISGFKAEVFAAEPQIMDPVELIFDEYGKIYVVEMPDYPFKPAVDQGRSRVRVLEDKDGDGRIDASTIFVDGLMEATSVLPWKGGLLVCSAPNIYYFKDTDGDNVADDKEVLFTGFFGQNSEAQITNLRYGLDNWIYAANFGQKGRIFSPKHPEYDTIEVQGADFRFRLEPFQFEAATGITQFGHDQDDWGHRLVTQNTVHARHLVIPRRYLIQNPLLQNKQTLRPTYEDGTRMYQLTPAPYWRAERTERRQKRYDEQGNGRIEHAANHFTGCSGSTFYLADGFPESFYGTLFTGEVAGNLVHRDLFLPMDNTPSFRTLRPAGEKDQEFLASNDPWFRPANFSIGPDGYLYVVDMYRQHIETPLSIPEDLKTEMDFNAGKDMGRIYRILPQDSVSLRPNQLALLQGSGEQLLSLLAHKNRWYRLQAQRLIVERQDVGLVNALAEMSQSHDSPLARMHAMYCLEGLGALDKNHIIRGLSDPHPGIRENSIKLGEQFPEAILLFPELAEDPSPLVALQAVLSIGASYGSADKATLLAKIAQRRIEDQWFRLAIMSALPDAASAQALQQALEERGFWEDNTPAKKELVEHIAALRKLHDEL